MHVQCSIEGIVEHKGAQLCTTGHKGEIASRQGGNFGTKRLKEEKDIKRMGLSGERRNKR